MISQRYFKSYPASGLKAYLRNSPWPHLVLDNFLSRESLGLARREIGEHNYVFRHSQRGTGRIEYSLLKSPTLWKALYSAELITIIENVFGFSVSLDKGNMLQLRKMDEATPEFPRHNDYLDGPEQIVSFLYLSPGWKKEHGGRLALYKTATSKVPGAWVEPLANRLIAFHARRDYWHSVERVRDWTRLNVLVAWYILR